MSTLRLSRANLASDIAYYGYPDTDYRKTMRALLLGGGPSVPGLARGEGLGVDTWSLPWSRWLACKSQGKQRVL